MRIAAEQTVAAPPEAAYRRLTDFGMFEARARRRNLPVQRLSDEPPAWRIGVDWRGITSSADLRVETLSPPEGYTASVSARGVSGLATVAIRPDASGSVVSVRVDVSARGVTGRMLMPTLRLAQAMLENRLQGALARLAAEIESDVSAGADPQDTRPAAPRSS